MPKDVRVPLFDFAKQQNLYHFDIDQPDDNDIILKPKFIGDWQKDLDNFKPRPTDFNLEKQHTRMQIEEWMNLRYDISKFFSKMIPDETTPIIKKMAEAIPFDSKENIQMQITEQKPGQYIPYHMDVLTSSGIEASKVVKNGYRIIIFLTDWRIGQVFGCVDESITKWKAGDVFTFEDDDYHWSANTGMSDKYTIVISVMKDKFLKND